MDDDRNAYLDAVLIGGREPVNIVVVDYDDAWPARFQVLADRVRGALGHQVRRLEHIGSTSVPGLAEERDYLDLRDWLRVSSDDRTRYTAVKRRLAQQHWDDMNDYAAAKTDVVLDILTRARTWRAANAHPAEA
ncbi:MAG: GrpB family protein [Cellulomonas sp.]